MNYLTIVVSIFLAPKIILEDNKGENINSIRTKKSIEDSDVVIVKFGEKYKQWNAAFDAGCFSINKSIVVIHGDEHQHPLKEVDAAACAGNKISQAVKIQVYCPRLFVIAKYGF